MVQGHAPGLLLLAWELHEQGQLVLGMHGLTQPGMPAEVEGPLSVSILEHGQVGMGDGVVLG